MFIFLSNYWVSCLYRRPKPLRTDPPPMKPAAAAGKKQLDIWGRQAHGPDANEPLVVMAGVAEQMTVEECAFGDVSLQCAGQPRKHAPPSRIVRPDGSL